MGRCKIGPIVLQYVTSEQPVWIRKEELGACRVLERGRKEAILAQLVGSGGMLRSCVPGTLADPL